MQPREIDPSDMRAACGQPVDTAPLPNHLAEGIALGTACTLLEDHKAGTKGQVEVRAGQGFLHELAIRGPQGKVASVPLAREDQDAPTRAQREADARFLAEIKNNGDWILRAALFGLKQGFVP